MEQVNHFKYTGSVKTDSGDRSKDFTNKNISGEKTRSQTIEHSERIVNRQRIKIQNTLAWPLARYDCENYTIFKAQK